MLAKAAAPSALCDISLSSCEVWATHTSSGGRPGRFLDSGNLSKYSLHVEDHCPPTKYCGVELSAHRLPTHGVQLPSHGAGPGVGVSEQTEGLLRAICLATCALNSAVVLYLEHLNIGTVATLLLF